MEYIINDNYTEIIAGTSNRMHPAYMEAANNIEKNTSTGVQYLKNFLQSIENISDKEAVKDERISKSKGNVKNFEGYDNIKSALEFINKNLKNAETAKECKDLHDLLVKYQPHYTEAYDKKNKIVILEYESAVYMLVTSLSLILANNMDVVSNGTEIRIQPKSATTFGVIPDTMKKLVKEMKDAKHEDYLKELNKGFDNKEPGKLTTEGTYVEALDVVAGINVGAMAIGLAKDVIGTVGSIAKGSITLAKNIRRSLFGIIPMIRSIAYFRYKKKADTIISLDQQVEFIKANIEQLENRTNIDPKKKEQIIKKQKAAIEKYQKKSAKLRAQLMETEKEAAKEIEKENPQLSDADDDFVLESGKSINEIFGENDSFTEAGKITRKNKSFLRGNKIIEHRDEIISKFGISKAAPEKKETPTKEEEPENMKKIHDEIEKYRKEHVRKSIRLIPGTELKSDDESKLLDTKIGGTPYWPSDVEFPVLGDEPMIMVAQLNFDKLPKLDRFPTTGILQFFLSNDEAWGSHSIKVVYHKKPNAANALKEIPVTTFTCGDRVEFIDDSCYYPTAKEEDDYINHGNETPDPFKEIEAKFSESEKKDVNEAIWKDMKASWGTRIGGWPSYTQSEPDYVKEDTVQLLQLDSEDGMMWGDCGIAHFFINKADLAKKDFSKVMFTWDCC